MADHTTARYYRGPSSLPPFLASPATDVCYKQVNMASLSESELQTPARLDIGELLMAVEDAAPVAAADILIERLAEALGATEVSFLIADFGAEVLIRLGHTSRRISKHGETWEVAETVPLNDSVYGQVISTQKLEMQETPGEET